MACTEWLLLRAKYIPSLREVQPENQAMSMDKCYLSSVPMPGSSGKSI